MFIVKYIIGRWYNIGMVVAVLTIIYTIFTWGNHHILQNLLLLNFAALLIHQFEEYRLPGGEPAIINIAFRNSDIPDRYPLNQFSAMFVNTFYAYICYLIPVFFPNLIWLGLMPMLFGITQVFAHGIVANKILSTIYNPGLAACVLLHLPIGAYYIYYISVHNLISGWDWLIAIVYMVAAAWFLLIKITYDILPDRNTKYPFDAEEINRYKFNPNMKPLKKLQK
ncbi:TPA: HXXEE domain-containing protein [Staphylococcus aureus]|nr:HXXEE domain-containing protein [Staphylococcus aureus]HEB2291484.1 HXXEE domain-containing protein [Staphylococcus aureus]